MELEGRLKLPGRKRGKKTPVHRVQKATIVLGTLLQKNVVQLDSFAQAEQCHFPAAAQDLSVQKVQVSHKWLIQDITRLGV